MARWFSRFVMAALLAMSVAACDSGDDEENSGNKAGEAFTAVTACEAVFECQDDNFGFADEAECQVLYVQDCKNAEGFLSCGGECYGEKGCSAFDKCEPDCWEKHCP